VARPEHLTGKFNSHFANKMFVAIEEGFWAGDKSADGVLKDLITNNKINIERKGVDPISVRNCLRFMMTANGDWVVPATKDERRYCVIDVAPNQKQNRVYFGAIAEQLKNGGLSRMLFDLLALDLSRVDLNQVPETAALNSQKLEALSVEEQFWLKILKSQFIGEQVELFVSPSASERYVKDLYWVDGELIEVKQLHDIYCRYAKQINAKRPKDLIRLKAEVNKFYEPARKTVRQKHNNLCTCFALGSIEEARTLFEKHLGFKIDWEDL
jgi:hypothetical protein